MVELLKKASPCIILLDELVAFFRQLDDSKDLSAGKFGSNISFIQILTESVKAVPNAILLAALPESDTEAAGTFGRTALNTLEKYFGRVESVWKPVASDEAFEIVRRRLFESTGDSAEVDAVCREFVDFYRKNKDKLPQEVQESSYFERMKKSYPIHPEVFDRLYEDWSTLENFQKTRGVLQYMAIIIHRLWNSNDQEPLIMPASIPWEDTNVRNKSSQYLPHGWDPIIEKEVDGLGSAPARIDGNDTRFGSIFATTRATRTIFLGSAPSTASQGVRGISVEHILLGCALPGQTLSTYEDVLKRLRDKLHYLFSDVDRFWFDTRPNLRREMETRKSKVDGNLVMKTTKDIVTQLCGHGHFFSGTHVFTPHADIPDDIGNGPRLVVMPADASKAYSKANTKLSFEAAKEILEHRGEQARIHRNRLVFLAPDLNIVSRALDQCRIYLSWYEICSDIENGRLNLDAFQMKQAKKEKDTAHLILKQELLECYRYVLTPRQDGPRDVTFDVNRIGSNNGQSVAVTVEKQILEDQNLIIKWSPVNLKNYLQKYYFINEQVEISLQKVWEDFCNYYQMPRLLNEEILLNAICEGVTQGNYFGFALGKQEQTYLGFAYAEEPTTFGIDSNALLIQQETAEEYKKLHAPQPPQPQEEKKKPDDPPKKEDKNDNDKTKLDSKIPQHRHYFGTIELDPLTGTMQFSNIMTEIVSHFTEKPDVKVTLKLDIHTESDQPFDVSFERTIKENGTVLGIKGEGFTEE